MGDVLSVSVSNAVSEMHVPRVGNEWGLPELPLRAETQYFPRILELLRRGLLRGGCVLVFLLFFSLRAMSL